MTAQIFNFSDFATASPVAPCLVPCDPSDAATVVKRAEDPYASHTGDLYDSDATPAQNARTIRRLIKEAVKAGTIPAVKWSVKTSTYSGGASIRITMCDLPEGVEVFSEGYVRFINGGPVSEEGCYHASLRAILDSVEAIAERVQYKRTQALTDYCNTNAFLFVEVDGSIRSEAYAAAQA